MKILNQLLEFVNARRKQHEVTYAGAVRRLAADGDAADIQPEAIAAALEATGKTADDLQRDVADLVELARIEKVAGGAEDCQVKFQAAAKVAIEAAEVENKRRGEFLAAQREREEVRERARQAVTAAREAQNQVPALRAKIAERLAPEHGRAEADARRGLQTVEDGIANLAHDITEAKREAINARFSDRNHPEHSTRVQQADNRVAALEGQLQAFQAALPSRQALVEKLGSLPLGAGAEHLAPAKARR